MKRGEVWWAELSEPVASEPGYRRPVVIVQADTFNKSRISTIVVVAVTSNLRLATAPGNVKLTGEKAGLSRESVANVSQVITIDKQFLAEKIGWIDHTAMQQIDEGMRLVLAL
ncbi:MAG TPA: type II toxin-antitoxin system PemK/MazF family toxin [Candidatus Limnocylindria bacterium]|nr:type II toxin-antitoxin system PemK/MazF family toxin [Candidatus Limnocylindria bacterium]